jgi:hypothetical protein
MKNTTPLFTGEDPMAAACRSAVRTACDPATPRLLDAQGNTPKPISPIGEDMATPTELAFVPFEDGQLFKYSPNRQKPGTFFLHDRVGLVIALVINEQCALILAESCHKFFTAYLKTAEGQAATLPPNAPPTPTEEELRAAAAAIVAAALADPATVNP